MASKHASRGPLAATLLTITCSLVGAGCSVVFEPAPKPRPLDFSAVTLDDRLTTVGQPQGINVAVELSPKDLPSDLARRFLDTDQYRATIYESGDAQIWKSGPHEIILRDGRFQVGPFSYTPTRNARLIVFKERQNDFSFHFHGHEITIEAEGRWKPALFYSIVNVTPDGTPINRLNKRTPPRATSPKIGNLRTNYNGPSYAVETLQIGRRKIVVDGRTGSWTVDGLHFTPDDMILEGVVPFATP